MREYIYRLAFFFQFGPKVLAEQKRLKAYIKKKGSFLFTVYKSSHCKNALKSILNKTLLISLCIMVWMLLSNLTFEAFYIKSHGCYLEIFECFF